MLTVDDLQQRWVIFENHFNDLSIIEMILLFSQKKISNQWQQYEKDKLLEEYKTWQLPDPKKNAQARNLLHKIINCLLENQHRNPIVDQISKKNGWVEQWCSQALKYQIFEIHEYEYIASILASRGFLKGSEEILDQMVRVYENTILIDYLIKSLVQNKQYSKAIYYQKINIERTKRHNSERHIEAWQNFIFLLIQRDGQYSCNVKDIELAHSLNDKYSDYSQSQYSRFQALINEKLIQYSFKSNQAISTTSQLLGGLQRLNYNASHKFFGGNSELPYYNDLVKSAPLAVSIEEFQQYFRVHHHLTERLNYILKDQSKIEDSLLQAGAISAFSLWNYSQIQPEVLQALGFSSAGHPTDFFDLQNKVSNLSDGALTRLSGYVAEQQVAEHLKAQGHHVIFPEKSNQMGYDLLVDGHPMQVKCTTSASYIQAHLNNHPDIPVIINSEMAEYFKDHPNVIIDYDLSHETVQTVLADSVAHLDQFGSMQESVLTSFLAVFVSSKRHYHLYEYGGYEVKDAALHTIVDTSAKVSGVLTGKAIGFWAGAALGPVGAIVGATVGSFLGNVFASAQSDQFLKPHVVAKAKKVSHELVELAKFFIKEILPIRHKLYEKDLKGYYIPTLNHEQSNKDEKILLLHFQLLHEQKLDRFKKFESYLKQLLNQSFAHQVQAGWICLENANQFYHPKLKNHLQILNKELELYQYYALNPETTSRDGLILSQPS